MTKKLGLDCHKLRITEKYRLISHSKRQRIVSCYRYNAIQHLNWQCEEKKNNNNIIFLQLQLANANAKCSLIINNQVFIRYMHIILKLILMLKRIDDKIYNYKRASTLWLGGQSAVFFGSNYMMSFCTIVSIPTASPANGAHTNTRTHITLNVDDDRMHCDLLCGLQK